MKKDYLTRKESIVLTAIDIIGDLGIHELSVREIAKRQNITDASLYRHFKSKQEIIVAVLDYYSKFDENIMKTIKDSTMTNIEGIKFFIKSLAECFENYPDLVAIDHSYEIFGHDAILADKVKGIFFTRFEFVKSMVEEGKKSGEIHAEVISEDLTDIIIGIFRTSSLRWRMNKCDFSLKEKILRTLDSLFASYARND